MLRHLTPGAKARHLGILATSLVALAACGGGGGGGGSPTPNPTPTPPANSAPTANAGTDQSVDEGATVTLSGTGTDADAGDTLTYAWTQTGGSSTVTITDADQATATFVAPQVNVNTVLTFQLEVSDSTASTTSTTTVTVRDTSVAGGSTAISGKIEFEFVPANPNCRGLDFAATELRPVRQATVQLLDDTSSVLQTTTTDDNGDYAFTAVTDGTNAQVRVLSELKQAGTVSWDVEIRDNVVSGQTNPPALEDRPKYALDGAAFVVSPGTATQNLVAATGWDGTTYSGVRAAGPFAVMDSIYNGMRLVISVDPDVQFAPLDAYWSVNNALVSTGTVIDEGELGASFYRGDIDSLFVVGDFINGQDTEEFDTHVIVHEWGHYFEDTISRSDSRGGPHSIGDQIDARLAWGEGWATALSGMALGEQLYCDTNFANNNTGGFGIGNEDGNYDAEGWYDEVSVLRFIYDLWDTNNDLNPGKDPGGIGDPVSIGFGPIYQTMINEQRNTEAFTTIYSFATELRANLSPTDQLLLDDQLRKFDMNPTGLNIWGSNETNDTSLIDRNNDGLSDFAQGVPEVLPVYTDLPTNGTPVNICTNDIYDSRRDGNKLATRRFLRAEVTTPGVHDVSVVLASTSTPLPADDPADERDQSDPDIRIYNRGVLVAIGTSGVANEEVFETQTSLVAGTHVIDVNEFRYADSETADTFPSQVCWDVSMAPQ
ncbi:MAG: hypothetical protein AAGI27_03490 [Pseudomonadota bacterium]